MTDREKLKIGIIGTGWPGQQHAIALQGSDLGCLYACADLETARRDEFVKMFSPAKSFGDCREMLADPAVDAVAICLPNFLHFPASLAALEAGKHVFCEKPPTMNVAEMKVLREEAVRRERIYFFSRQFRFTSGMLAAKRLVEEGRLGTIYHAKATWVRSRGIPIGIGGWFTEKKRSGGGALIDIGVHALDSVWYLMGTPKPVSVTAGVFRNFPQFVPDSVFDVEDSAFAFIRFETGAVVHLETCWAGNLPDDIAQGSEFGRESNNSVVYGSKGTIRLKPLTLFEDQRGALVTVPVAEERATENNDSFARQMTNFLGAIRGEVLPVNHVDQATTLMEMLDAIYASSSLGREVPIA